MYKIIAFLCFIAVAKAQIESPGQCNASLPVQQNYDVTKYMGTWFQIHKYDAINEVVDGNFANRMECITATYTLNGAIVTVDNRGIFNHKMYQDVGNATVVSTTGEAKLEVMFPTSTGKSPLWVLETDYVSYSLVYSCQNLNGTSKKSTTWVLSREPYLKPADTLKINDYITKDTSNAISWNLMKPTIQWGDTCNSAATKGVAIIMVFLSAFLAKFF